MDTLLRTGDQMTRVLAEAYAAGAFTDTVLEDMAVSMDLEPETLRGFLEANERVWEFVKLRRNPRNTE